MGVTATDSQGQKHDYPADAVVFAVGITGEAAAMTSLLLAQNKLWHISSNLLQQRGEPHWAALHHQWLTTVPAELTQQQETATMSRCNAAMSAIDASANRCRVSTGCLLAAAQLRKPLSVPAELTPQNCTAVQACRSWLAGARPSRSAQSSEKSSISAGWT